MNPSTQARQLVEVFEVHARQFSTMQMILVSGWTWLFLSAGCSFRGWVYFEFAVVVEVVDVPVAAETEAMAIRQKQRRLVLFVVMCLSIYNT